MSEAVSKRELAGKLTRSREHLLFRCPFYGRLLLRMPFAFADCQTAATDAKKIYFDPTFLAGLSGQETEMVLLHEVLHCVLGHCFRGRKALPMLFNAACDIVVNSLMMDILQLKSCTVQEMELMHLHPNGKEGRLYTAEEVYQALQKLPLPQQEALEAIAGKPIGKDDQNGSGSKSAHTSDSDEEDNPGEDETASQPSDAGRGGSGSKANGSLDSHGLWIQQDDSIEQAMEQNRWQQAMRDAVKQCGPGSLLSQHVERQLHSILHTPKADWRRILYDLLEQCEPDYSFVRPDPRYPAPYVLPRWSEDETGEQVRNLWIAVDASASMAEEEFAAAMTELKNAFAQINRVQGWISFFDTRITRPVPFESLEDIETLFIPEGLGTSFDCLFDAIPEFFPGSLPAMLIILTDGYASFPSQEKARQIPVVWMMIASQITAPWGISVPIELE